jgi:SAM-dependent methyltransferase
VSDLEAFYKGDAYQGFKGEFSVVNFEEYADFVHSHLGSSPVIELGSGSGAAAYALHLKNVAVTASDIYTDTIRRNFSHQALSIPVLELNAEKNHLPSNSIPNYCLYAVLEHLRDPASCLKECYRTLEQGGKVVLVSPNLFSPLTSLRTLLNCLTGKWKAPWFIRSDGYRFPFGSTFVGAVLIFFRNLAVTLYCNFWRGARRPRFRTPCLKTPAVSDSDAVFMVEPLTLRGLLESAGFEIVSFQEPRRTGTWAGSVWIVGVKTKP